MNIRLFVIPLLICGFSVSVNAATVNVSMTNFVFTPADIVIEEGDTVVWTNDAGVHTATSGTGFLPDGLWDSGTMTAGNTFQRTFTEAGEFSYHCTFHWRVGMAGTVTVVPPGQLPLDPLPSVRANGVADALTISPEDALVISLGLDPGGSVDQGADWWFVTVTPFGAFSFDVATVFWAPGLFATLQIPLLALPETTVSVLQGLPAGEYTFLFGVDLVPNGEVDLESLVFDAVIVTVTPGGI